MRFRWRRPRPPSALPHASGLRLVEISSVLHSAVSSLELYQCAQIDSLGGKKERKDALGRCERASEREREIDVWSFDSKSGVKCGPLTYYHTEHVYSKAPVWLLAKLMAGLCVYRGMFYSDGFGPSFTIRHV